MIVFLDFEASSLGKRGFPVEVGWIFEDGRSEDHLIRPAPGWEEWSEEAEAIHGLSRDRLAREGEPHDAVARRMVEVLTGHDLYASAPSWDGQWLSRLLRAAGLPRKALTLRDSDEIIFQAAVAAFRHAGRDPAAERDRILALVVATKEEIEASPLIHRALADARRERLLWQEVIRRARAAAHG